MSPVAGWVGTWLGEIARASKPGIHIVSNFGDVDDDTLPIVREVQNRIASIDVASPVIEELFRRFGERCRPDRPTGPA